MRNALAASICVLLLAAAAVGEMPAWTGQVLADATSAARSLLAYLPQPDPTRIPTTRGPQP